MSPTDRPASSAFKGFEHAGWQAVSDRYHASFRSLTTQSIPASRNSIAERVLACRTRDGFAIPMPAVLTVADKEK